MGLPVFDTLRNGNAGQQRRKAQHFLVGALPSIRLLALVRDQAPVLKQERIGDHDVGRECRLPIDPGRQPAQIEADDDKAQIFDAVGAKPRIDPRRNGADQIEIIRAGTTLRGWRQPNLAKAPRRIENDDEAGLVRPQRAQMTPRAAYLKAVRDDAGP